MPATDLLDQQAARAFESQLWEAVKRLELPPVELEWFSTLPKRIWHSGLLLETAQAEARVLLEFARGDWAETRKAEREREDRLARAQDLLRNLECLRAPDPAAWNSLGCHKKRCRAFDTVGHAFTARHHTAVPASAFPHMSAPVLASAHTMVDVFALHAVPTCPFTPPGIREAL
ncbi:hypothetical protein BDV93DRAFT_555713 [Ceratobasidium sp. AG-I]|nr:hypothetical protein BDV93DRAFT_555713 [Ceratobasidium sp. AG-I]